MFSVHNKMQIKAGVFESLWFEEGFQKALCSWWISVDGRPQAIETKLLRNINGAQDEDKTTQGQTSIIIIKDEGS